MGVNTSAVVSGSCLNVVYFFDIHDQVRYHWIGMAVCLYILSPLTVLLNTMILSTIYKNRELWSNTYFFMAGLAFTDFLTGLLSMPITGTIYLSVFRGWMSCRLYVTGFLFGYVFIGTSFVAVVLLATDRYLAVFHPFMYERWTHDRFLAWKLTLFTWVIVFLLTLCSFFTARFIMYFVSVITFTPISILWIFYIQAKIVKLVNRVASDIEEHNTPSEQSVNAEKRKYRRDRKVTFLAAVMIVTMVIGHTPALVVLSLIYSGMASDSFFQQRFIAYGWSLVIASIKNALNPLIYGVWMTEIRRGIKELISGLFQKEMKGNEPVLTVSQYNSNLHSGVRISKVARFSL